MSKAVVAGMPPIKTVWMVLRSAIIDMTAEAATPDTANRTNISCRAARSERVAGQEPGLV